MKRLSTSLSGRKDPTRVPMRSSNVPSRPAGEVYNCGMLPAGISNSANNCYSSAVLQCLFNHIYGSITPPSHLFSINCFLVIPNAVVLTAANFQVSEYSIELTIIQVLASYCQFLTCFRWVLQCCCTQNTMGWVQILPHGCQTVTSTTVSSFERYNYEVIIICTQKSKFPDSLLYIILARHLASTKARSTVRCSGVLPCSSFKFVDKGWCTVSCSSKYNVWHL